MLSTRSATGALMTPAQVASFTNYSVRTVRRWRALGWLRPVGLGTRPRYKLDDVVEVMNALATLAQRPAQGST